MKKYFLFITCFTLFFAVQAQKLVSVASQRFEEQVAYQEGDVLKLKLEKVQVSVVGKEQDFYGFEIILKSKHKDQEQAIEELGYLKYQLGKLGDTILFSNDFVSGERFRKIQGVLSVELKITAPVSGAIVIDNAYGKTHIRNINAPISLAGKFVETKINECRGELDIVSAFGEHQVNEFKGDITLDLSRVDFVGSEINGDVKGRTSYGSIHINELATQNFDVDSRRTAFELVLADTLLEGYNLDLSTQLGQVLVEGSINQKTSNQWKYNSSTDANIKITTTFSPITIRDQSLNAQKK